MLSRALPIAVGLVAADYAVWTWATSGERVVPAVVTGLALPPLAIALAWVTLLAILAVLRRGAAGIRRRFGPVALRFGRTTLRLSPVTLPRRPASAIAAGDSQHDDAAGADGIERRVAA